MAHIFNSRLLLGLSGGLFVLANLSCDATEPYASFRAGQVSLAVVTTGFDLDPDGYIVVLDARDTLHTPSNGVLVLHNTPVGEHTLRVSGLAPNCRLRGASDRVVIVQEGLPARETLDVRCRGYGNLTVVVETSGQDVDFDGYVVTTRDTGEPPRAAAANDTVAFVGFVVPETLVLELSGVASNCVVAGGSTRNLSLPEDGVLSASFGINCVAAPGTITAKVRTVGYNLDPDGYTLTLDQAQQIAAASVADVVLADVGVGMHLIQVSGMSQNCYALAPIQTLIVGPHESVQVSFDVRCTPPLAIAAANGEIRVGEGSSFQTITQGNWPAWAPTGNRLVFSAGGNLWTVDADGSGVVQLTHYTGGQPLGAAQPQWSPNGTMIAFSHAGQLTVINADGTGLKGFNTGTFSSVSSPTWSPTSSQIVFQIFESNVPVVRFDIINADGSGHAPFFSSGIADIYPSWSPDGQHLVFTRVTPLGSSSLMSLRLSDNLLSTLATWTTVMRELSWAPDNSHVIAWTDRHELLLVPAGGGRPVVLLDSVVGASWRP
jgi:hypothetical protein